MCRKLIFYLIEPKFARLFHATWKTFVNLSETYTSCIQSLQSYLPRFCMIFHKVSNRFQEYDFEYDCYNQWTINFHRSEG